MKGAAERLGLYRRYIAHYETASQEGSLVLCGAGETAGAPGPLYTQVIKDNLQKRKQEDGADVITHMIKGLAILELICVNLFLCPWRKEIRTLKKFTGNFVYFVEPVIPEKIVNQILQRVGYSIIKETEYIIGGKIHTEEAKRTAFELYLARHHCEELLCLINENNTKCVNLLASEPNLQINKIEHEQCAKISSQIPNTEEANGPHSLTFESKKSNFAMPTASIVVPISQDLICEAPTMDSSYSFSRHLDSEEFLNKYSDLNLAQQPIFPLHNRHSSKDREFRQDRLQGATEPKLVKLYTPGSEPDLYKAEEIQCDAEAKTTDVRPLLNDHTKSVIKKQLGHSETPAEVNMPNKQGQTERLVIKLKMGKLEDESLAYPVEETLPPDPKELPTTPDMSHREPMWTLKSKDNVDEANSSFSSNFSILNSKGTEWSGGVENLHRLREPPSSMYIPPGGTERQCLRITDLQSDEHNYQAPSPVGDMVLVNETLFKVNEDTKEGFVMITKP